jgi:hypothetical protein
VSTLGDSPTINATLATDRATDRPGLRELPEGQLEFLTKTGSSSGSTRTGMTPPATR